MARKAAIILILVMVTVGVVDLALLQRVGAAGQTWIVISVADSGPGTLRSGLQNATIGDTITFDSSVFPPTSPVTINLTSELPHIIQGNLTIDASGAGVILNGNHTPTDTVGLLVDSENNTIKGLQILHFWRGIRLTANARACSISGNKITNNDYGIWLSQSSNNSISRNDIANNTYGIFFEDSSNNTITGNNITNNGYGIWLLESTNNFLSDNNIANNQFSFTVDGKSLSDYVNNVDSSNTVDGKPLYYFVNKRNMTVPIDGGYLALINCTQMTIKNLTIGPFLAYTTNSTITENNINGIGLYWSSNNRIYGNKITNNSFAGITFNNSTRNSISENNITNNYFGIFLWLSFNNSISENDITENINGIAFAGSDNNTIYGNNIINNNSSGIYLGGVFNKFYHNNFINNTMQVSFYVSNRTNFWNTTYFWNGTHRSGGNYWSDYAGVDQYSGPRQNITGSDGIGDTPYFIDSNNQDNYPFMPPDTTPPTISILSPEQLKHYPESNVSLTFAVDESTDWMGYSLDAQANVTILSNETLTSLVDGAYYVTVYANDTAGNMGASDTIWFYVDTTPPNITRVSQTPPRDNVLPEDEVRVDAEVSDNISGEQWLKVSLNYTTNNGTWFTTPMTHVEEGYTATIPQFPYCTIVTYIIIAEDNATNIITSEQLEYDTQYHVIPEFPSFLILPLFMIATLLTVVVYMRARKTF